MLSFNLEGGCDSVGQSKAETNNTITMRTMNKSQDNYILTIENLTSEDRLEKKRDGEIYDSNLKIDDLKINNLTQNV